MQSLIYEINLINQLNLFAAKRVKLVLVYDRILPLAHSFHDSNATSSKR